MRMILLLSEADVANVVSMSWGSASSSRRCAIKRSAAAERAAHQR
jgi:hypothetical protein